MDLADLRKLISRVQTAENERDSPLCRVTWVSSTGCKGFGKICTLAYVRAYFDNPHLEIGSMWEDKECAYTIEPKK